MTEPAPHRQEASAPRAADSIVLLPIPSAASSEAEEEKQPTQTPNVKEK